MSNQNLLESPGSPPSKHSGRHQIKRSLSELTSPVKLHRTRQQRDDKPSPTSSSLMQPRHSIEMARSEAATPTMSPNQSRRASILIPKDGDDMADTRPGPEEKPEAQQPRTFFSTDGLKQSLMDLSSSSVETTRRLDETYYSVLEKMTALQNTVSALKDVAEASRDIQVGFERTAQELESDITKQLRSMGQFQTQQRTIETLQSRIHQGREKVTVLVARVDAVRVRVEAWERADKAWQERTRKRLRITWTVLSILILLLAVLFATIDFSSQNPPEGYDAEPVPRNLSANAILNTKAHLARKPVQDDIETRSKLRWKAPMEDGERLRVFDEL